MFTLIAIPVVLYLFIFCYMGYDDNWCLPISNYLFMALLAEVAVAVILICFCIVIAVTGHLIG